MNTIKGMIEDLNNKDTHIGGCTTVGELIIALERLQMLEEQEWGAKEIEGSEDCVKREDAKQFLYERLDRLNDDELYDIFSKIIDDMYNELPSVQPRPKRGKWIRPYKFSAIYECSVCHKQIPITDGFYEFYYCPNCGADMREVQDD